MLSALSQETFKHKLSQWISDEYRGLNGSRITTLDEPPTALEFSRHIHISRPVIIKGFRIPATKKWTNEYLMETMKDCPISIAITPNGRADAVTPGPDNKLYFVEPHVEQMSMTDLLDNLSNPESDIHYLQSQNGNLFSSEFFTKGHAPSELEPLRKDVPSEVSWCSEALDRSPDAVNLWIGDGRSTTSIHSDPYENIYTVVRGEKQFTLLPPSDSWCMQEREYPHARYSRLTPSDAFRVEPSEHSSPILWSSILDPDDPDAFPSQVAPIHVRLRAGETLYLPAGWWHYVRQASKTTIAINWWYDMEMQGMHWVVLSMLRNLDGLYINDDEEEDEE